MDINLIGRIVYDIEKYLIVFIAIIFALIEIRMYIKYTRTPKKLMFFTIGIYWAVFYMVVVLDDYILWDFHPSRFAMWARAGILFTISILCGQALNKWWRLNR